MVFLKALDDVSVEEWGTLALRCEVSDHQAHVVWRKDGMELGPSDKYEFLYTAGTRGLTVHNLSRDDAGLYTCDVGTDETRAHVSVHGACCSGSRWRGQGTGGVALGVGVPPPGGPTQPSETRGCSAEPGEVRAGS